MHAKYVKIRRTARNAPSICCNYIIFVQLLHLDSIYILVASKKMYFCVLKKQVVLSDGFKKTFDFGN